MRNVIDMLRKTGSFLKIFCLVHTNVLTFMLKAKHSLQMLPTIKCRFCSKKHWLDESPRYKTIGELKQCRGSCYKFLKENHCSADCKSNRRCICCNETNAHHRSLFPKRFKQRVKKESMHLAKEANESDTNEMEMHCCLVEKKL